MNYSVPVYVTGDHPPWKNPSFITVHAHKYMDIENAWLPQYYNSNTNRKIS